MNTVLATFIKNNNLQFIEAQNNIAVVNVFSQSAWYSVCWELWLNITNKAVNNKEYLQFIQSRDRTRKRRNWVNAFNAIVITPAIVGQSEYTSQWLRACLFKFAHTKSRTKSASFFLRNNRLENLLRFLFG
ncbi:Hypothetical_protein [Hexamita inflata]|uniref:Hypothetical_protein n=1 Tax=Hexamita inflata TaxID=28002 RepID=A0AA86U6Y3_9EUKA|nr:Hypothetical protein HINF_LOCUS19923 [Hexamita inflata]